MHSPGRRRPLILLGAIGLTIAAMRHAADASDTPAREQVIEWITQLDAPQLVVRTEAARQLERAGPSILPWLPSERDIASQATRDAITRLRVKLERQLAEASVQPGRVTFDGRDTVSGLSARLVEQTQNPLGIGERPVPGGELSVTWNKTSFWDAVGDIERSAAASLTWSDAAGRFEWRPVQDAERIAASVSGPARLVLTQAALRPLPSAAKGALLRCEGELQVEPRLRPLFVQVKMADWSAQTGDESLPLWNPAAEYELPFPERTGALTVPLDFRWPDTPSESWSLSGRAVVHIAAGREPLEFAGPNLVRGASVRRGGVAARIRDARFVGTPAVDLKAQVRITINYDQGGPAFESHRVGLFYRSAWLIDRQGNHSPATDFEVAAEADGGMTIDYRFEDLSERPVDYRFVYEAPTLLLDVPLSFQFHDLPPPSSTE